MVLVGNKIDLRGKDNLTNERLKTEVMPIMDEFKVSILGQIYIYIYILIFFN